MLAGIALAAMLGSTASSARATGPSATVTTFLGNFEVNAPGWAQFTALQFEEDRPLADSFSLVDWPVRSGRRAARITARQGYSRFGYHEDTSLVHVSNEQPGDDYWYAFSVYFPQDWLPPYRWGIFAQWHATLGTSPIIAFNARADTATLNVRAGLTDEPRNSFQYQIDRPLLATMSKGRWNDFVMHVRWTKTDGGIEVWHRLAGQVQLRRLVRLDGIPTLQWTSGGKGLSAYLLLGLYRGSYCAQPTVLDCPSSLGVQPPSTLYLDSYARATTFADVVRAAFPNERTLRCRGGRGQPLACKKRFTLVE
jgi:hypothetical protein